MCGIVGYIGSRNGTSVVLDGLKRLEYRGYDSAGIAVIDDGKIKTRRGAGKISNLENAVINNGAEKLKGNPAIGHTRWATHGKPSEENAHPHSSCNNEIVVVHNGIIENFIELKKELLSDGHVFKSETDTEVIAHLLESYLATDPSADFFTSVVKTIKRLRGAYALAAIYSGEPDRIIAARKDAPLIVGLGEGENFIASDIPAVLPYTRKVIFMEDGDVALLTKDKVGIYHVSPADGKTPAHLEVPRNIVTINWDSVQAEKGGYKHFMLKEILEQPQSIQDTFRGRLSPEEGRVFLDDEIDIPLEKIRKMERLYIVACGTSYHAGLVGKYLFERYLKIPCEVDIASEFRYRHPVFNDKTFALFITQSGETADTLASLRLAGTSGATTLAIANVVGSTASREARSTLFTRCGPEIGVASTKAFTGQLTALYLLLLDWGLKRNALTARDVSDMALELWDVPVKISEMLKDTSTVENLARKFFHAKDFLYLGRNINYPIALEGALKLKEISYIHAEGYAAGEMKHGPIALIDENMPVMVIATNSDVKEKIISNIEEVSARLGTVIALVSDGDNIGSGKINHIIKVPAVSEFVSPIINVIPLQLFAYYCAVLKGNDVDQPRNLAKSVTVE